jgi:hypothetical protein
MLPELDLSPRGCQETLHYYDVADYYETALVVFNESFSAKERATPRFLYILNPIIEAMISPAQVNPIARMIVDLKLNSQQLQFVTVSYVQALAKIRHDDFTFRASILYTVGLRDLIKLVTQSKTSDRHELVDAFRRYVLKQLNGTRCSDGIKRNVENPQVSKYTLPNYVLSLNQGLLIEKPIDAAEIEPEKIVEATRPYYYWGSKKSSDRLDSFKRLVFKGDGTQLPADYKEKPEWQAALDKYLLDLGMWEEDEEPTREDFINKKSILFLGLIEDVVPSGPMRDSVLREFTLFLSRNELRGETRLQWVFLVRTLIQMANREKGDERARMLSIVKSVKNPTMDLYVDLLELPTKPNPPAARQ